MNPGSVVKHVTDAYRPVLLTSRGRGVAVVQSVTDYEAAEEERAFMRGGCRGSCGSRGRPGAVPRRGQGAARPGV